MKTSNKIICYKLEQTNINQLKQMKKFEIIEINNIIKILNTKQFLIIINSNVYDAFNNEIKDLINDNNYFSYLVIINNNYNKIIKNNNTYICQFDSFIKNINRIYFEYQRNYKVKLKTLNEIKIINLIMKCFGTCKKISNEEIISKTNLDINNIRKYMNLLFLSGEAIAYDRDNGNWYIF
jgi:hypothetical protein